MITLPISLPSELVETNMELKSNKRVREDSTSEVRPSKASFTEHSPSSLPHKAGSYVNLLSAVYDFNEKLGKYPSVEKLSDTMLMHGFLTHDKITNDDLSHYNIPKDRGASKGIHEVSSSENIHTIEPKVQSLTPFQSRPRKTDEGRSEYHQGVIRELI